MLTRNTLRISLAIAATLVFLSADTGTATAQDDADWKITILHGGQPVAERGAGLTYRQAYNMVPFSRSEYDANPSYRHDTAVELMFNEMRPTSIYRSYSPRSSKYPVVNDPTLYREFGYGYYGTRYYRYAY